MKQILKKVQGYNIGLDIGTNSVGWVVTDENANLLQFRKKNMWGARLFEKGDTAQGRRLSRSTRRRYDRRRQRIHYLQEMLATMVLPIDESFFIRLNEAFLWKEDKSVQRDYILFADKQFTDRDFYKQFKTIYHLRKFLLDTKEKADPRFIYLALHHMIKYRGNFLYQGQSFDVVENVQESFRVLLEEMYEQLGKEWEYGEHFDDIQRILENTTIGKKSKQEQIAAILTEQYGNKKLANEVTRACLGYSFDLTVVMENENLLDESGKKIKLSFSDSKYEEQELELQNRLEEKFAVIEALKRIYNWLVLKDTLRGKKYISEAMVNKYEAHHEDLVKLKRLFRTYLSTEEYSCFFRKEKQKDKYISNYVNYRKGAERCSKEKLYKAIHELFDTVAKDDVVYQEIVEKMDQGEFLTKQNEVSNAYIPYQCNEVEMKRILKQQGEFYPELKENADKILQLLLFRIPYYVGPLVDEKQSKFAWMKRRTGMEQVKIYPWNFEQVVDIDQTAEAFITRMTNYCTYLPEEKVLPKQSLLYSEYELLQELNKIKINGKFSLETRNKIIEQLFKKQKKVTEKQLKKWLVREQYCTTKVTEKMVKLDENAYYITGFQKENEFASSLTSYIDFTKILGEITERNRKMIEEIIYWLTVFEEKSIVKRKIQKKYGNEINDKQLAQILKLNYSGWGRFSEKFLNGIKGFDRQGQKKTIMELLREDSRLLNIMQIINNEEMGFCKIIEANQKKLYGNENLLDVVQELHGSPAIKRGIWQSLKIVEEIISIMGGVPQNIFIEFAREDDDRVRTSSRVQQIERLYKKFKEEVNDFNVHAANELKEKRYQNRLDEEKVFLYFMQNGKSLYSGVTLDIDRLNEYEVDHIIPRTLVKDDSLENKALVLKGENQRKGEGLIPHEWQNRQKEVWKKLLSCGLMGKKKYANLCKESFGNEKEQKHFIARQIVETRQIIKQVANILAQYYQGVNVAAVKASLGSELRENYTIEKKDDNGFFIENKSYTMLKSRKINDFHHAQDAYLACSVGLYIKAAFPKYEKEIDYEGYRKYYQKKNQQKNGVKNEKRQFFSYVMSRFSEQIVDKETGEILWDGTQKVAYIKKIFGYRDCLVTKKLEENTGEFYNQTINAKPEKGKEKNTKLLPIKKGLSVGKYGGYQGGEAAYSCLVRYQQGRKTKVSMEKISVIIAKKIAEKEVSLDRYLKEKLGVEEIVILRKKVMKNQLIEDGDGNRFYLTAATEVVNAKQFILDGKHQHLLRTIAIMEKGEYYGYRMDELEKSMDELYAYYRMKIQQQYSAYESIVKKIVESHVYENLYTENNIEMLQRKGKFLMQLLRLTQANAECIDLKTISDGKLADRMGRKGGYTIKTGTKFIDQSITGLYERYMTI